MINIEIVLAGPSLGNYHSVNEFELACQRLERCYTMVKQYQAELFTVRVRLAGPARHCGTYCHQSDDSLKLLGYFEMPIGLLSLNSSAWNLFRESEAQRLPRQKRASPQKPSPSKGH